MVASVFGGFERDIVNLAQRGATAFTRTMTFADNGHSIGMYRYPHPGDIDGQERPAVFPGQDAAGFDGLPVPAVEAKDPIGFRNRVPASI